jgi:hypothetical protein
MRRPGSAGPAHLDQELFLGADNHQVRNTDRFSGAVGLVVSILIGVSWIVSGFASIPLAWKFGLGTILGLVAADYLLLAVTGASIRERWVDG